MQLVGLPSAKDSNVNVSWSRFFFSATGIEPLEPLLMAGSSIMGSRTHTSFLPTPTVTI